MFSAGCDGDVGQPVGVLHMRVLLKKHKRSLLFELNCGHKWI
jgi:hypothetical protein